MLTVLMLMLTVQMPPGQAVSAGDATSAVDSGQPEAHSAIQPRTVEESQSGDRAVGAGAVSGSVDVTGIRAPVSSQRLRRRVVRRVPIPRASWGMKQPYDPSTYGFGRPDMWKDYYQGRSYQRTGLWWLVGSVVVTGAGVGAGIAMDSAGTVLGSSIAGIVLMAVSGYYLMVGNRLVQDATLHIFLDGQRQMVPVGMPMPGPMMAPPPMTPLGPDGSGVM